MTTENHNITNGLIKLKQVDNIQEAIDMTKTTC